MSSEISIQTAMVTLQTLRDVAEATQIPGLATIPCLALEILTAVQDAKQNKDVTRRLFNDSFGVALTVVKACERMAQRGQKPPGPVLQSALEALRSAVEDILELVKSQAQDDQNRFETTVDPISPLDALALRENHYRQQLQLSLNNFQFIDVRHTLELVFQQTGLGNAGNSPHSPSSAGSLPLGLPQTQISISHLSPEATRENSSSNSTGPFIFPPALAPPQSPHTMGPWNIHNHNNYNTNVYYVSGDHYNNVNTVNRDGNSWPNQQESV